MSQMTIIFLTYVHIFKLAWSIIRFYSFALLVFHYEWLAFSILFTFSVLNIVLQLMENLDKHEKNTKALIRSYAFSTEVAVAIYYGEV